MRNLSLRALALLKALNERPTAVEQLRGARGPHREALLLTLGAQREAALVLPLFRFLFLVRDREARATARALYHLVSFLGPEDVRGLDEALREAGFYESDYLCLGPEHLDAYAALSPAVSALLACHPNGFLRQAALLRLAESGSVAAWPFLLVRLNDWVGPVREAALRAARAVLPQVSLELLARHLPLVEGLRECTRADHGSFVEQVLARLREPDGLTWLVARFGALPGRSRRTAFRLLLEGPEETARHAVERGLEDSDPVVRRLAAERVEALFSGEALVRILARMERSRSMTVRREAYVLYARGGPGSGEAKVREALMDPSRAIREYAQLRLAGTVDAAELYREALREGPSLPGALAGLGETGRASDTPRLALFLAHPRVAVRREAVTALGRLDGAGSAEALRELFFDPSPGVAQAAAHALARVSGGVTPDWLRRCLFRPGLPPHVTRQALRLTEALSHWEALLILVEATGLPDESLRERVHHLLRLWLDAANRRFVPSTPAQIRALQDAVRAASCLEPVMARSLAHLLRAHESG